MAPLSGHSSVSNFPLALGIAILCRDCLCLFTVTVKKMTMRANTLSF